MVTVIAFTIGNMLMFCFGAVGGAYTGKDDIFYVMIAQGLAIPAIIVLGANIWTTNDNALYTGSLGLSNITKVRKRPMVIVSGVLGTALAVWLYNNFVSWLNFLNATLPPIGMIIMMDYFMHRASYGADTVVHRKINWGRDRGRGRRRDRRQPDRRHDHPHVQLGHLGRQRHGRGGRDLLPRRQALLQGRCWRLHHRAVTAAFPPHDGRNGPEASPPARSTSPPPP